MSLNIITYRFREIYTVGKFCKTVTKINKTKLTDFIHAYIQETINDS